MKKICVSISILAATAVLGYAGAGARAQPPHGAHGRVPSECSTVAQTPDYPTTLLGPTIAALQQASGALLNVTAICRPSSDPTVYSFYDEACRASVRQCEVEINSALQMEDPSARGYEIRPLRVVLELLRRPVGGQQFSVPSEQASMELSGNIHRISTSRCDPASPGGLEQVESYRDGYSSDANFYRQVERTYQQWWSWVRGLCRIP